MQLDFHDLLEPPRASLATLADLLACYDDAVSTDPKRSNIRSSIRAVGRGLRRPLDQIPANAARLQLELARAGAAAAGVKPRSWISAKSMTITALRKCGVDLVPSRDTTDISPDWMVLLDQVPGKSLRIGISRLLRHLSRTGVGPHEIATHHLQAYHEELVTKSVKAGGETTYRRTVRHWHACARSVVGWPQLDVVLRPDSRCHSLDWGDFPEGLKAEIDQFVESRRTPDPLSDNYARKVRPATECGRIKNLRVVASALALSGKVPAREISGLSVLTEIEHVRSALRWLRDTRFGGAYAPQQVNIAELLRTIAKHWEGSTSKADAIRALISALNGQMGKKEGITEKNRERLAQFDDPRNVVGLVGLPIRTLRGVEPETDSHLSAVRAMYALQIGILLSAPIRLKNLVSLKLGVNIHEIGTGKRRDVRIWLPKAETKTYQDYVAPLPSYLYPLYDAWISRFRPVVCDQPSPYLFPNSRGQLRNQDSLSSKISRFIERETGLKVNIHLFRHLAAKLYLAHNPDGLEVVRQLLGHKSIETTLKAYAELQTDPAFRRLEEAVLAQAAPKLVAPKRGSSR